MTVHNAVCSVWCIYHTTTILLRDDKLLNISKLNCTVSRLLTVTQSIASDYSNLHATNVCYLLLNLQTHFVKREAGPLGTS